MDIDTLVTTLNEFEPRKGLHGSDVPTVRALSDALEEVIKQDPIRFTPGVLKFFLAKTAYQYAVLNAFKALLSDGNGEADKHNVDWASLWPKLIQFCESLLTIIAPLPQVDNDHDLPLTPNRHWLVPGIAEWTGSKKRTP